jgi:hypothetical protein
MLWDSNNIVHFFHNLKMLWIFYCVKTLHHHWNVRVCEILKIFELLH